MKKRAFLIGGFQKAQALTASLGKKGYKVTIVNEDMESCRVLAELSQVTVICGDGTRPHVLDDAGAMDADVAIALTRRDEDNLVICELCKKKFKAKKTIALVSDPKKIDFFYQMGIDSAVCSVTTITNVIEQHALMDQMSQVMAIGEGRVKIVQVAVHGKAPAIEKEMSEINLPRGVIVACILRGDKNIIPHGETRIKEGDVLILVSSDDKEAEAIKELAASP